MSIFLDIERSWGDFHLSVQLEAENETLALLGASGCGKSMTLRCIAGVERPDRGRIVVDGVTWFDSQRHIDLPPQARRAGLLFQNYALFPHMSVLENIRAGARRKPDAAKREAAIQHVMSHFGLTALSSRRPAQLSGGQQQRVALARILVSAPQILLLDEPFSALDAHLRFQLEQEVRQVIRSFDKTVLLVSHDRNEVFRMADRIAIMNRGTVETCGSKQEIFTAPGTKTAAMLTGCKNISRAKIRGPHRIYASDWGMELSIVEQADDAAYLGIRPHDIRSAGRKNRIHCRVAEVTEAPFSYTILLRPADRDTAIPIAWEISKDTWHAIQAEEMDICLPPEAILLLKENRYAERT